MTREQDRERVLKHCSKKGIARRVSFNNIMEENTHRLNEETMTIQGVLSKL